MALNPRQAPARIWRRLALASLLALLLCAYWMVLRSLEARADVGTHPAVVPAPLLDRHTPRVD